MGDGQKARRRFTFLLTPVPPFRLDLTVWALRRRPANAIDRWNGKTYRRILAQGSRPREVAVSQAGARIRVVVAGQGLDGSTRSFTTATLERMLGLRTDLSAFYMLAAGDTRLNPLARLFCGVKPTRFPTLFETLINAISCQQLSLSVGILLLNRLAEAYGLPFVGPDGCNHAFPRPQELAAAQPRTLRSLGYSLAKARAIIELAEFVAAGRLDLESLARLDDQAVIARLLTLRGVGRWTAEYVLLRGLGKTHIFPGDDVGARKRLGQWMRVKRALDYEGVRRATRPWKAYAGFLYFHLLLTGLLGAEELGASHFASGPAIVRA